MLLSRPDYSSGLIFNLTNVLTASNRLNSRSQRPLRHPSSHKSTSFHIGMQSCLRTYDLSTFLCLRHGTTVELCLVETGRAAQKSLCRNEFAMKQGGYWGAGQFHIEDIGSYLEFSGLALTPACSWLAFESRLCYQSEDEPHFNYKACYPQRLS